VADRNVQRSCKRGIMDVSASLDAQLAIELTRDLHAYSIARRPQTPDHMPESRDKEATPEVDRLVR